MLSYRKRLLKRLRAAIGEPAAPKRWRTIRYVALAGVLGASALSVGWWVYSRTTDQDLYHRAEKLWRAGRYKEAETLYERLFIHSPQVGLAENALFDAATICHYHLGDRQRSIDLYSHLIGAFPNGRHAPEACLRLAQIYESDLGDLRQAIRMWEESIKVRPHARVVMSTEQYLGVLSKISDSYFTLNEFDRSLAVYQRIAEDYPGTHNADQANVKVGIILQTQRLYRLSLKPLKTAVQTTRCADCRFMAQTALVEAYEQLEDLDAALQLVDTLAPPPGQEDYPDKERRRLRSKQQRLAAHIKAPRAPRRRR